MVIPRNEQRKRQQAMESLRKKHGTSFSGEGQYITQESTRDLYKIFENLVVYFDGGTVFPSDKLLDASDPKQVLVITDTFIHNGEEAANAISELKSRHKGNNVTIYAMDEVADAAYLKEAGAEVIHGTTTDIFKRVIGKAEEVYSNVT